MVVALAALRGFLAAVRPDSATLSNLPVVMRNASFVGLVALVAVLVDLFRPR